MRMKRWMALMLAAVMLLSALPGALAVNNSDVKITGNCPSEDAKLRNNGHHYYFAEVDDPWCTRSGTVWWNCVYCGDVYEETLPALGHDFHDDWRIMYEATCDTSGLQIRFCYRCQQEETREIPALGHIWAEQNLDRIEPTCTENGHRYYTRQCSRCGMYDSGDGTSNVRDQVLPALGHDWGPWKVEYPGTCVQKGMNVRKCRRCGLEEYVYSDYGDHDWGEWEAAVPAQPGIPGMEKRVCRIEATHVETRDIPPLPEEEKKPALEIAWDHDYIHDADAELWYNTKESGVLAPENDVAVHYTVTNTGNTTLVVVGYATWDNGKDDPDSPLFIDVLDPGQSAMAFWDGDSLPISSWITPGTATDELLGTAAVTFWAVGVEELEDLENVPTPLCETERLTRSWQVAQPVSDEPTGAVNIQKVDDETGEPLAGVYFQLLNAEGQAVDEWETNGQTHCIEGLAVGEQYTLLEVRAPEGYDAAEPVSFAFGEDGKITSTGVLEPDPTGAETLVIRNRRSPQPEEEKAELTVYLEAQDYYTREPRTVFSDGDVCFFYGVVENTGNVTIELIDCDMYFSDGFSEPGRSVEGQTALLHPGEKTAYVGGYYWFISPACSISADHIAPGTETETLAGTLTYSVVVRGYRPGTHEVLCTGGNSCTVGMLKEGASLDDTATFTVQKVWDDGDDSVGARPETVKVYLLWDGESIAMATLSEDNGWTAAFDHMPLFDSADGHAIEYTWQEEEVESYILTDVRVEGCLTTLTNTYNPGTPVPDPDQASLTLTWISDSDRDMNVYPGVEHQPDDWVWVDFEAENTGAVPLAPMLRVEYATGDANQRADYSVMEPEETWDDDWGTLPVSAFITPGTETETLYGTVTITLWYDGLDPETGEKLCESNQITRTWKVLKEGAATDGELKPELTLTASWEPDEGEGKCYLNAPIQFTLTTTNTGNCPVNMKFDNFKIISAVGPGGPVSLPGDVDLQPNESVDWTVIDPADAYEVEHERYWEDWWSDGRYTDADGERKYVYSNDVEVDIPLTYPEGGDPDPAKPALEIKWTSDEIYDDSADLWYFTTEPGVLEAEDSAYAYFDVTNVGNMPLKVITYATWANGQPDDYAPWTLGIFAPGESDWDEYGAEPLGDWITSGTDTAELLGTATVTFWAKGFDPETGEELCETEHLSRTWQVRKPGPTEWEIPEESKLEVSIGRGFNDQQAYPEGHQLGEWWDTNIYVFNNGPVDVEDYTLHVDVAASACDAFTWGGSLDASDGATWYEIGFHDGIAAGAMDDLWDESPDGEVYPGDVSRGSIKVSAYVTWEDPDSLKPRTSNVAAISLPVISRTGLLLQKGLDHGPADGEYFKVDEVIDWTLTVKNTSDEPICNVAVTDGGAVVGTFAELAPGQKEACAVPGHKVTEYDADVVGYVLNQAFAEGDDLQGARHTYPSNVVQAICSDVLPPDPPSPPTPPDKTKEKDGDPDLKGDGGEACLLTLTAIGDSEARYTLHACAEHLAAAQAAEAALNSADRAEGWQKAADIWRGEIEKLYGALYEAAATDEARAAVRADQEAYWACVEAYAAMNAGGSEGQKNIANLLRLRCAELCCMKHTAPEALPDSLLGDYAALQDGNAAGEADRVFSPLIGSDSQVTVHLNAQLTDTMRSALAIIRGTKSAYASETFASGQAQWQMALDSAVNARYKAADREARKPIAAWRKALDQVIRARRALLDILYEGRGDIIEERVMHLYRDAAIDAEIMK